MADHVITEFDDLRGLIGEPNPRVLDKQLAHLDRQVGDDPVKRGENLAAAQLLPRLFGRHAFDDSGRGAF